MLPTLRMIPVTSECTKRMTATQERPERWQQDMRLLDNRLDTDMTTLLRETRTCLQETFPQGIMRHANVTVKINGIKSPLFCTRNSLPDSAPKVTEIRTGKLQSRHVKEYSQRNVPSNTKFNVRRVSRITCSGGIAKVHIQSTVMSFY
jgi:hypothetical protein